MKDKDFIRGEVPMTKEEVRSIVINNLEINPTDNFIDIGAGSGSVAIDVAKRLDSGKVLAIERHDYAVDLIKENCKKHSVKNIEIINAKAPAGLENLSNYNKFFIGGSGGNLELIVDKILNQAPEGSILVITAIVFDTVSRMYNHLKQANLKFEMCQVAVNYLNTDSKVPMLLAKNPIFIITVKKE
ncbi:MAG: precorrin-6Y C5,15-methyltransferase (decarboxylating) subunit CbiT [Marinifilaceae bacterium]|jgi:precorrin-6Y C5,15-methyltransferase (decarboxylating) CbiT subunit|nr:precorrin-6Y C5,15-methyltransferase (decarboxylating) subunit CbiT [Marinifilaceae bacterium]